jgi:hypothetical protein
MLQDVLSKKLLKPAKQRALAGEIQQHYGDQRSLRAGKGARCQPFLSGARQPNDNPSS